MSPGERAREEERLRDELYGPSPTKRGKCIRVGIVSFDKDGKLKYRPTPQRKPQKRRAG
jgi:hypothetical protein